MNILIATSRFEDLAGSELTVLEYANELIEQGNKVSIASFASSDRYRTECDNKGIKLSTLDDEDFIRKKWDLIWVFHQPTFYALFSKWKYSSDSVIYSSLSHFEPLEAPPLEIKNINLFTVNSKENLAFFNEQYPQYSSKVVILPNSVPRDFWRENSSGKKRNKIAIVSNHVPMEIIALKSMLEERLWKVDIFGVGYEVKRIDASLLLDYDVCISIGKTVQYCMALKIPVFCYDHFGGPGWIKERNVEVSSHFNFSGRCTNSKCDAETLLDMFNDELIPNEDELIILQNYTKEKFCLTKNISQILNLLNNSENGIKDVTETNHNILSKSVDVFCRDSRIQKEYESAFQVESQKRMHTESRLVEFKNAWDKENETRLRIERELLEINSAWELEKKNHQITLNKLDQLVNKQMEINDDPKVLEGVVHKGFFSSIIERIKGSKRKL